MLCKTTMRAALAHVLGTVGIVGAFGAGAAPDNPYAAESLSKGMTETVYTITATPMGEIVLDVEIDTLLENEDDFYLVVNVWSAQLTDEIPGTYTEVRADVDGASGSNVGVVPVVMPTVPMIGDGTGFRFYEVFANRQGNPNATPPVTAVNGEFITCGESSNVGNTPTCTAAPTLVRAFRGDATDSSGVYKMELTADIPIDTRVRVALGAGALAVPGKGQMTYYGDLYIYETLGDARAAARATSPGDAPDTHLVHSQQKLFEVKSKIAAPTITPHLATADVGYERTPTLDDDDNVVVSSGGPFRGFEDADGAGADYSADVGVLATIKLNQVMNNPATPMVDESVFLNAADGSMYDGNPNTGVHVAVTAAAGAFGFGNGAGTGPKGELEIKGDNPATEDVVENDHTLNAGGAPRAFKVSTSMACGGGGLRLTVAGTTPNSRVAIDPNSLTNPVMSADATGADGVATGTGPFYFCVVVDENEVAIPAIGDDRDLDGYSITATPLHGDSPGTSKSGAGGSIDRNGTTLNITYLSVHPAYNQRLVIVNRSAREAAFWMDEFQTEDGTMVMNEIRGTVASNSRMVIRVQDTLEVNEGGMTRASGTLNLTAPEAEIDVMTLQVHPGTGQIDTTVY